LDDAIAQYDTALRLKPDDAAAHYYLAVALIQIPGRDEEAKTHLEAALRLQPGNPTARKLLLQIRESKP
jgi:Flp pilus assembly protein TadD